MDDAMIRASAAACGPSTGAGGVARPVTLICDSAEQVWRIADRHGFTVADKPQRGSDPWRSLSPRVGAVEQQGNGLTTFVALVYAASGGDRAAAAAARGGVLLDDLVVVSHGEGGA